MRDVSKSKAKYEGRVFTSNKCGDFKVVDYVSKTNVLIEFLQTGTTNIVRTEHVLSGHVKDRMYPSVHGVGFFGVGKYNSKEDNRVYGLWSKMLMRCYNHNSKTKYPTYKDVSVCDEWHNFQNFAEWCYSQDYFNCKDEKGKSYQLDKDILVKGNKIYSPETCCFVPAYINTILLGSDKTRGIYPKGVSYRKDNGKFGAQIQDGSGKQKNLGCFETQEEAFQAYKQDKESYIKEVAERWKGGVDPRVYKSLMNWTVEIDG